MVRGGRFETVNTSLSDLISFAYGVHAKQMIGVPPWAIPTNSTSGQPDLEGRPNDKQKGMLQKLLADRFKLSFHHDKRELSVYVLGVAKTGSKLTKSEGDPNGPGLLLPWAWQSECAQCHYGRFCRPHAERGARSPGCGSDRTYGEIRFPLEMDTGRLAIWRDGRQDSSSDRQRQSSPGLYTAIQEQIGLRMGPAKAPDDVLVIDHVEKPSEN